MGRPKKQQEPVQQELLDENVISEAVESDLPFNENLPFIHPDLKATLETHPHINCVWLDDKGNWYFCDRPGFTAYSREQILNW